jgi:hypothetical protein
MGMLEGLITGAASGRFADEPVVGLGEEPAPAPEKDEARETQERHDREIRELREQISRPPAAPAGIDPNQLAQSFAQALAWSKQWERATEPREPAKAPEPPSFFDGDPASLLEDPEKLKGAFDSTTRKAAQWGYDAARRDLEAAYSQQARGLGQIQGFLSEMAPAMEDLAFSRAEAQAERAGYFPSDERRREVTTRAAQLLDAQANGQLLRMKPEAWKAAMYYVVQNDPAAPRSPAKSPPSAGDGDRNPPVGGSRGDFSTHPSVQMAAQLAGRKPTEDEIRKFQGALQ